MPKTLAALALGIALVLPACGGGDGDGETASDEQAGAPAEPPLPFPGATEDTIGFLDTSGSKMTAPGCSAHLKFIWRADDPASVPPDAEAVIKVAGPGISGTYRRPLHSGTVTLNLSTPPIHRSTAELKGTLVSVGGKPVSATPNGFQFLNQTCGGGQGPAAPSPALPPGAPVEGAPWTPGEPLPPGFECKRVR